jgi:hypothetical protein
MTKGMQSLVLLLLAGAIVAALTLWRAGLIPHPLSEIPAGVAAEPPSESAPAAARETSVSYPLDTQTSTGPLKPGEVRRALVDLLGRELIAAFLQVDEFPRRVVATVDNLGRSHAPHLLWPVNPTPDRFMVDDLDGPVIAADNTNRYTPFVLLAESVDSARAADLYVRMYPLLQAAYQELGYPNGYFNDRLIAVIDLLLATPELDYPVKLQLTEVRGLIPSLRPWTRYEFADPALESLAAGQKILLRVGPVNQRRLMGKLAEFRGELMKRARRR